MSLEDNKLRIEHFLHTLDSYVGEGRGHLREIVFPGRSSRVVIGRTVLDLIVDGEGRIVVPSDLHRLVLESDNITVDGERRQVVKKERVEEESGKTAYWALRVQ